jgi:coenzyme F420-reducing hydrogenase beta subunit
MTNIPAVIKNVVESDLCTGCGLCVYKCPSQALAMQWNENGFLTPSLSNDCDAEGQCIAVCPFNPSPAEKYKTEKEISNLIFLGPKISEHHKIGKYKNIYAGFSTKYRLNSSSGGIATFVFSQLLERGVVAHIISVKEAKNKNLFYEYAISSSSEELLSAAKTKYYPVTLGGILFEIRKLKGKVAISGISCFVKALRLAQLQDPVLNEKIKFVLGIICGGIKSKYYADYLAGKAGAQDYDLPEFRVKNLESSAGDYSFACIDKKSQELKSVRMKSVGDMWGTGLFKANACDYCDDATNELADISLGDAWIEPYHLDGKGTNLFVTRSDLAEDLILFGEKSGKLSIEPIDLSVFLKAQKGSFNHRHIGLPYRIKQAQKKKITVPPKTFDKGQISLDFKLVQKIRMKTRQKSIEAWKKEPNSNAFDKRMRPWLVLLKYATAFDHYKKAFLNKLKIK